MIVAAELERLGNLIRQLQGALRGTALAAGRITGGGGSTYTIAGSAGVTSIAGQATGRCRIVVDGSAVDTNSVWPSATVSDNGAHHCTCVIIASSPVTFDVYQWDAAGVATNRSFFFDVTYKPA